jgi:hypothetical protein
VLCLLSDQSEFVVVFMVCNLWIDQFLFLNLVVKF